ncbi:glycoside hydrolase superfamily [Halteromyces radiatus]|uniref:glycoside hydrolase superfamily n=1 Tax=Halteromyces radiatus TaxID=101107 RepID=UPI0022204EEB|nr:glycoside hydrolase superfamily [Halteromyces radiatus]KAI8089874.1 glycoside hydrolase superfamily [Halteromyces radiatus]
MKAKMPQYEYINMDSGWCQTYDEYGRWTYCKNLFPHGLRSLSDYLASNGHKLGIYILPGIRKDAAEDSSIMIKGTQHPIGDIVKNKRDGNGFLGTTYMPDDDQDTLAQLYYDSLGELFAEWGISFVKIDGCGPGGGDALRPNQSPDNRKCIAMMKKAFEKHNIWMELSWYLDASLADEWATLGNGARIFIDIESYSKRSMTSSLRVFQRITQAANWADTGAVGSHRGFYIDLDVVTVGMTVDGKCIDGLDNDDVRLSYITFWAITSSIFCLGADPRCIPDKYLAWFNHPDMLTIHQSGIMARPIQSGNAWTNRRQIWWKTLPDGRVAVGLFNTSVFMFMLGKSYDLKFTMSEVGLKQAIIKDVWTGESLGKSSSHYTVILRPGQCKLLLLTPCHDNVVLV